MRVLLILPNWLGDAIMTTASIESLCEHYPKIKLTLVGSKASIEVLRYHPLCEQVFIDETKKTLFRLANTRSFAQQLGSYDLAISFRNNIYSNLLLYLTKSKKSIARASLSSRLFLSDSVCIDKQTHLVEQYQKLVDRATGTTTIAGRLRLFIEPYRSDKRALGINAGATYGSAKRWYPDRFAKVAARFSDRYSIVIFGSQDEVEMADEIEDYLKQYGVTNYTNLAGKTSLQELVATIASLDMFITNDSGPMHIAAAYRVPTVCIFGPTRYKETSQWSNPNSILIREDMECSPCMKRECPTGGHECMKSINSDRVIESVERLIDMTKTKL